MGTILNRLLNGLESVGVVLGKDSVFLEELPHPPEIRVKTNRLIIRMEHSLRHSAKEIYKVDVSFQEKAWLIRAFQKLVTRSFGKPFYQDIQIPDKLAGEALSDLKILWIDPDGTEHPMDLIID